MRKCLCKCHHRGCPLPSVLSRPLASTEVCLIWPGLGRDRLIQPPVGGPHPLLQPATAGEHAPGVLSREQEGELKTLPHPRGRGSPGPGSRSHSFQTSRGHSSCPGDRKGTDETEDLQTSKWNGRDTGPLCSGVPIPFLSHTPAFPQAPLETGSANRKRFR